MIHHTTRAARPHPQVTGPDEFGTNRSTGEQRT
jgi:hypothetical protein